MKTLIHFSSLALLAVAPTVAMPPAPRLNLEQDVVTQATASKDSEVSATSSNKSQNRERPRQSAGFAVAQNTGPFYSDRLQSVVGRSGSGGSTSRALLIFSTDPDSKARTQLQQDLAVMHHLLNKSVDESLGQEQRLRKAMGVNLFFAPDSAQFASAYLEDYGALFMLKVNFPLLASGTNSDSPKEEVAANSAWEEARQEVFGESGMGAIASDSEPFNEEKVNRLKSSLIESLKNAANIRELKPNEGVTVCLSGAPIVGGGSGLGRMPAKKAGLNRNNELLVLSSPPGEAVRGTQLTIRAKKGDIDAFAKGQMNLEEFRRKVQLATYEGEAGTAGVFGHGGGYGGGYGIVR